MNNYRHGFISKCAEYGVNPEKLIKAAQGLSDKFDLDKALSKLKETNPRAYEFYTWGDGPLIDDFYNNFVIETLKDSNNPYKPVLGDKYKTNPNNPILRGLLNGNISEMSPDDAGYNNFALAGYNLGDNTVVRGFFRDKNPLYYDPGVSMVHEHIAHNLRDDSRAIQRFITKEPSVHSNPEIESDLAAAYPHFSASGMYKIDEQYPGMSEIRTRGERGAINSELQWEIYKKLSNQTRHQPTAEEFRKYIENLSDAELSQLYANKAFFSGYVNNDAKRNLLDGQFSTGYNTYNIPGLPLIKADRNHTRMTPAEFRKTQLYKLNKDYFDGVFDSYRFNPDSASKDAMDWDPYPSTLNVPVKGGVLPKEQLDTLRKLLMWFGRNKNKKPVGTSQYEHALV
jgi:hypothetical protein